jgi:Peptidase family M28
MRRSALGVTVSLALLATAPAADAAVSGAKAKRWTAKIASLGQRPAGWPHERQAGAIVKRRLERLGYSVAYQSFTLPNGRTSRNVVGRTGAPVRVIVVAHIDGVWGTDAANDNASGVGLMLELARNLSGRDGVLVAGLAAEERMVTGSSWHLGSRRLTRSLSAAAKRRVRLALSIDMVGVGSTLHVRGLEASPNRSARILLAAARELGIRATYLRDTGQSDHDDLTRGGVPAAWVEWRWDPCWHQPCDQIERVRPWKLWRAGRIVLAAARSVLP